MKGTVRWFNSKKGYGFIAKEDGGKDLFVHYSGIVMKGYKNLTQDDVVEFDVVEGPKGEQAGNVKVVGKKEEKKEEVKDSTKKSVEGGSEK